MNQDVIAIVPAAGLGKRFDKTVKKTFISINGIPLIVHTLKRLQAEDCISEIIPVLRKEDIQDGLSLCTAHNLSKVKRIAEGGKERQDSIHNAIKLLEQMTDKLDDICILIHDGARPLIPDSTIANLLDALKQADGVIPGIPAKETLKEVDGDGFVVSTVDRSSIMAIQTPQVFRYAVIKKAYDFAFRTGYYATDDAALVEKSGGKIKVIPGNPYNIKITTREDLNIMQNLL